MLLSSMKMLGSCFCGNRNEGSLPDVPHVLSPSPTSLSSSALLMVLFFLVSVFILGVPRVFPFLPLIPGPKQCAVYTVAPSPTAQVLGCVKA